MKKVLALILVLMMVLSLAACAKDDGKESTPNGSGDPSDTSSPSDASDASDASQGSESKDPVSALTDEELVAKLTAICDGKTGEMPVETTSFAALKENGFEVDGLFKNWFNNMDVPEGAKIAVNQPMMGQAHVVLLIQPGEGMTAEALRDQLKANANPNWMICMTADSVDSAVKDGLVLFVMTSKEELGLDAQSFIDAFNA